MAVIDMVAKELHMNPKKLLNESLKSYLEKKLSKVEADIFLLAKKYIVINQKTLQQKFIL